MENSQLCLTNAAHENFIIQTGTKLKPALKNSNGQRAEGWHMGPRAEAVSAMCSNLKSAAFSLEELSNNHVHAFNSLKISCSWLLQHSLKEARNTFFLQKTPAPPTKIYFKRVKISMGLCSVLHYCHRLNDGFYGFLVPCFLRRF